ncbi:flavodoxin [Candidatus Acetatifactor stercoripullorum]|uniref:flavodoxin n=1 Tax=Candidatus Acetatifactor stercoripullorum TaxID=2838414 RepID=UPI00298D665C|nr:flavodoxin [Candidatus Acetatifactor stercoripullorum]
MKSYQKKTLGILLSAALSLSLAACGNSAPGDSSSADTSAPASESAAGAAPESASEPASGSSAADSGSASTVEDSSILIAYFTAAENSGVDAVASASYSTIDGGELIDYAAIEQDENARPELTTHIENLEQYDTVFIGYPNWWADLPMAVYSFFDEYDFSGKTIIPFNVHNGSRFSRTIQTIEELEPDAAVIEDGFTVNERDVPDAAEDVAAWLEELGYGLQTGLVTNQILDGAEGEIHYSYYLPDGYSESREYPLMMAMPGYDMMWFGEDSAGSNVGWRGFLCWTELDEDMIVVSAQLTDWGEKSARQALELTEYFVENFSVDSSRVYAAGYSAGGETMSQAVSMRPDLYAAYLHGASQWDGDFVSVPEEGTAVYIFMAENDEYYGSERARDAYEGLYEAYESLGWTPEEIDGVLQVEIPDNAYFNQRGITGNYHGGGNVLFEDSSILSWIVSHHK